MICKKCSVAADMITIARDENFNGVMILPLINSSQDTSQIPTKESVRAVAHLYHGLCQYSNNGCDCQHHIVL